MTKELSLTQSSIAKTNRWFAAEHSIRGVISNVMLIANTHFIEMDEEDVNIRRELKEVPLETRMSSHSHGKVSLLLLSNLN